MHFSSNRFDVLGGIYSPPSQPAGILQCNYEDECERGQVDTHASCAHETSELMQCSHVYVFGITMRKVCSNSQRRDTLYFWNISKFKSWSYLKTQEANKVISKNLNLFFVKTKFIFC